MNSRQFQIGLVIALGASLVLTGCHGAAKLDFNGDGYADLAIGVPGQGFGLAWDAGEVNILYGSSTGLSSSGYQVWDQHTACPTCVDETRDQFGHSLAAGDFGNSSQADLAIGVPGEDYSGVSDAGVVNIIYGSSTGLSSAVYQWWDQHAACPTCVDESGDYFGDVLAGGR